MSANNLPINPVTPVSCFASLTAATALTSRAPIPTASIAGLIASSSLALLSDVSTNGRRVDKITVTAASTSMTSATVALLVGIWQWDGSNAYLIDEITVSAQTPSTIVVAFQASRSYTTKALPAAHKLYVSTTVTTTASTTALTVCLDGGDY
ncbi:MAG: hypothetical protein WCP20_10930 [Desulfuromonadales bacterium]